MNRRAQKPDAQGFDEVKITTVPRFKTSGLSGDEWRISSLCQLLRKGRVIHEFRMRDVENCAKALPAEIMKAHDDGKFMFAGEENFCDQEGCCEQATVYYRLKKHWCNEPYKHEPTEYKPEEAPIRAFCERHSKRGDSSFEDSDSNYEVFHGQPQYPKLEDVSPSSFGGVIKI